MLVWDIGPVSKFWFHFENIEELVDGHDWVPAGVVEASLELLPFELVGIEESRSDLDEVEGLFVLALLREHLEVQTHELLVDLKVGLLHELEQEQVGDVQDLRLEPQRQADQVHALDGPLRIDVFLQDLVQMQALVLLLEKFAFANIRKE